jgi:hypothetical protein
MDRAARNADLALPTEADFDQQQPYGYEDQYGYGSDYYDPYGGYPQPSYGPPAPPPGYPMPYGGYPQPSYGPPLDLSEFDVPSSEQYYDSLLDEWGAWNLAGASAGVGAGRYGAVFIGRTRSGEIIGRCIAGDRDEAARGALEQVRDGALDVAEEHPYVRAAAMAMKGLRKLLRKEAGGRRPRQVEDDEALDLVGLARYAEAVRCR